MYSVLLDDFSWRRIENRKRFTTIARFITMPVFTLTIMRHGETTANRKQIIQGQLDTSLSDRGLRQAQLVAQRLQYEQYTHMFSSDLCRAAKTAHTVLACNQMDINTGVVHDKRLRERKFGVLEGKHVKQLREAAKLANIAVKDYTPSGAETIEQLRHRAILFFQEVCQLVQDDFNKVDDCSVQVAKKRKLNEEVDSGSLDEIFSIDAQNSNIGNGKSALKRNARHNDHSNSGSTSGCSSGGSVASQSISEDSDDTVVFEACSDENQLESYKPASIFANHDRDIMNISGSQDLTHGCPNVSLSPLLQHRLSSISSISSGRNNSFDDVDSFPTLIADVLVSTHGGVIRELVRHFIDDLDCQVPGGKHFALRTSPNTGLSKFAVSIDDDRVQVTCIQIHDKDHLTEVNETPIEGLL